MSERVSRSIRFPLLPSRRSVPPRLQYGLKSNSICLLIARRAPWISSSAMSRVWLITEMIIDCPLSVQTLYTRTPPGGGNEFIIADPDAPGEDAVEEVIAGELLVDGEPLRVVRVHLRERVVAAGDEVQLTPVRPRPVGGELRLVGEEHLLHSDRLPAEDDLHHAGVAAVLRREVRLRSADEPQRHRRAVAASPHVALELGDLQELLDRREVDPVLHRERELRRDRLDPVGSADVQDLVADAGESLLALDEDLH